jgi:hypothetical protein
MAKTFDYPKKIKSKDLPKDAVKDTSFTQELYWCYKSESTKQRYWVCKNLKDD